MNLERKHILLKTKSPLLHSTCEHKVFNQPKFGRLGTKIGLLKTGISCNVSGP